MSHPEDPRNQDATVDVVGQVETPDGQIAPEIKGTTEGVSVAIQQGLPTRIDFVEKLKELPVKLIPKGFKLNLESLRSGDVAPHGNVLVCDTAINDKQKQEITLPGIDKDLEAQFIKWGYRKNDGKGEVLNIDHHFRRKDFYRAVSSTNLAMEYVKEHGSIGEDYTVIINHTDCDSLLSSAIMRGMLPPEEKFGVAAIASDHTGAPNDIADLLQACEHEDDIEFSLRNLQRLLNGEELEPRAQELLKKRLEEREMAAGLADKAKYSSSGRIAYIDTDTETIDGAFFLALLPKAEFIVIVYPRSVKDEHGKLLPGRQAKVRLGMKAKPGTDVTDIVKRFDPLFGGRWNAGGDDRWGGFTFSSIEEYVELLEKTLVDIGI